MFSKESEVTFLLLLLKVHSFFTVIVVIDRKLHTKNILGECFPSWF